MIRSLRFLLLRISERWIGSRAAVLLGPFSWLWELAARLRNWLYDKGYLPVYRVGIPVVSVGNVSAGGTGKTPLVIYLAKQFPEKKVAVLSRGYGAARGDLCDELQVIQRHVPEAMIYQGKDRVRLAQRAEFDGADWILLDDGFQHRRLHRDLDFVIVRKEDKNDSFLPKGRLRDFPARVREPIDEGDLRPRVTRICDAYEQEIASIEGERVAVFCGLGRPERFLKTVEDLGAEIAAVKILGDHEPFWGIESFWNQCKPLRVKYLICTEKDFVKLGSVSIPVLWIEIETEVRGGQKLIEKIGSHLDNCAS